MPQVTGLKPQKNNKRVNVYLDNKFGFGIDLDNLVKFGIKTDAVYSNEEITKIVYEAEFHKSFEKLLRFAMTRPRSEKEVADWFKRKKVHESMQEKLIAKIRKLDLLDDTKFAKWWIEQRLTFRQKSIRMLKMELVQKGIEKEIINNVLADTDIDELTLAKNLVKKKQARWDRLDPQTRKKKDE